jgi:cell division septation protein DedD
VATAEPGVPDPGKYSVQVGSFRQETEATTLTDQLRATGYRVRMVRVDGVRGLWYQVFVGPYGDLDEARQDQMRVRQLPGYADARLVTH